MFIITAGGRDCHSDVRREQSILPFPARTGAGFLRTKAEIAPGPDDSTTREEVSNISLTSSLSLSQVPPTLHAPWMAFSSPAQKLCAKLPGHPPTRPPPGVPGAHSLPSSIHSPQRGGAECTPRGKYFPLEHPFCSCRRCYCLAAKRQEAI